MTHYQNWADVKPADWPWPDFSPRELACKGTGQLMVNHDAMTKLQALRTALGKPLIVVSAYRSPEHNARVGGATNSYHMRGVAFDISMANHDPAEFERAARAAGFKGFGSYPRQGFMHVDTGPRRAWGTPFSTGPTALPPEPAEPVTPLGSTTLQASAVQIASGAGTAVTAISVLDGNAQLIVIAASVVVILAALWIMRERVKRLLGGER
jgi:zinc D-Ala-D-Ala carboxypeptidase